LNVIGPPNDSCTGGTAPAGEAATPRAIVAASSGRSFMDVTSFRSFVLPFVDEFSQQALANGW
jgi:hypothetical protein